MRTSLSDVLPEDWTIFIMVFFMVSCVQILSWACQSTRLWAQLYLQPSPLDVNPCVNDVSGELGRLCSPNNNQLFPAFLPCELKDNQSRSVALDSSYESICSQLNFIFLLIKKLNFKAAFMKPLQTQFSRSNNKNAADGLFLLFIFKKKKKMFYISEGL